MSSSRGPKGAVEKTFTAEATIDGEDVWQRAIRDAVEPLGHTVVFVDVFESYHELLGEAEALLAKIETALKNLPFETRRAEADHEAMAKDYEGKLAAKGFVAGAAIDTAKGKTDAARALVDELRDRDDLVVTVGALPYRADADLEHDTHPYRHCAELF